MADNRGGANGGPQYNPANINPLGGNGQSGNNSTQAMMRMPDMPWGQGQTSEDIGRAAALAGSDTSTKPTGGISLPFGEPIKSLTAPTDFPDRPVTFGNDQEMSNMPAMTVPEVDSALQFVQAMYMQDPTNQDLRYILETASNQGRI